MEEEEGGGQEGSRHRRVQQEKQGVEVTVTDGEQLSGLFTDASQARKVLFFPALPPCPRPAHLHQLLPALLAARATSQGSTSAPSPLPVSTHPPVLCLPCAPSLLARSPAPSAARAFCSSPPPRRPQRGAAATGRRAERGVESSSLTLAQLFNYTFSRPKHPIRMVRDLLGAFNHTGD